jgi:peptidoglycan/xylan/chitin deacetylase (PgdA/CDA1 family)
MKNEMDGIMTKINKILIGILIILSLASNASAMSKVMITFDDGWTDDYYKALPIMQTNHQNGTAFIITGEVANASGRTGIQYMNLSQLKALYSAGWDLSSHTVTHPDLTTLSAASLNYELVNSKAWLNNSGFTKASRFLAYPYGAYNSNVETAVKNAGYISARTVNYGTMTSNLYELPTLLTYGVSGYGNPATTVSYVETEINKSISSNGILIITFHLISDVCCKAGTNAPEEYKTSDFKAISDFLKNESDANQLQVITMSQYFGTSIPTPTPPTGTPNITSFSPPTTTVTNNVSESRTFSITTNQTVNVSWLINGTEVFNETGGVKEASYTNNSAAEGIWNVTAVATNVNGTAVQTWDWTVKMAPQVTGAPNIASFNPPGSTVMNNVGDSRTFSITVNQTVNVNWHINGSLVFSQTDVSQSSYTNNSAAEGTLNVTAIAQNANGTAMQTWVWTVTPVPTAGGSISGYKINDTNGNGKWNAGEKGISNWTIGLNGTTGKGKNAKVIRKEILTDATGFYKFDNLPEGRYVVIEMLKKGFVPTSSSVKRIKLAQGKNSMNNNFTNRPVQSQDKKDYNRDIDDYEAINRDIDKYKEDTNWD